MRVRSIRALVAAVLVFAAGAGGAASAADPASPSASDAGAAASAAGAARAGSPASAQFRVRPVDDAWRAGLSRDPDAATQAYLDRLPADVVARSNAYFEGGYWLQLWNFLLGLAIAMFLLSGRRSARLRDWAQRVGRKAWIRDAIFGALYAVAAWLLSLPLTIYQGYVREHEYAMATQTFGPWFAEQLIALTVSMVSLALVAAVLYAVLRRVGERWGPGGRVSPSAFSCCRCWWHRC
jgi:STE24 endopeptidase